MTRAQRLAAPLRAFISTQNSSAVVLLGSDTRGFGLGELALVGHL